MLRGLSARFWDGLWNEWDADYADCTDYADFEICLGCSMQNLDAFGAEDFSWKVLVDGARDEGRDRFAVRLERGKR
jgi:hypothetical protein